MKKFIVLALFGLLIVASTVSAQKLEFKASGTIDFDSTLNMNVPFYFGSVGTAHARHDGIFNTWYQNTFRSEATGKPTGSLDHTASYTYGRATLKIDAVMSKELSGTMMFEIDAFRYGGGAGPTSSATGGPGGVLSQASERNTFGVWSTDRAAVEVKNIYIDVGLPYFGIPVPMTLRVGAQPFGVRPNIFLYTDGAGITGGIKVDPVTIIPMWGKINEGLDPVADDADLYGLHMNAKIGTFTVGGYGLNYNMNAYPLAYATGVTWSSTGLSGPGSGSTTTNFTTSSSYGLYAAGTMKANFWWFGGYMDGKLGPVNLNFDFVYDKGKVERRNSKTTNTISESDVDYSGWATRAKIDFPWEKFNFGVVGMYATGADADKTSTRGLPGDFVANPYKGSAGAGLLSKKVGSYVVPPGSEQSPANGESLVMYSCFNAAADGGTGIAQAGNYYQVSRGGFGGTWFAKLYGSAKLTPWYKITLQGLYIGDTTKNGNTFGTAMKNPAAAAANRQLKDDSTIGWELDLINEIDIYKNLKFFAGFGYLFAGDALDLYVSSASKNFSPKNPWNLTTRLLYTF